MQFPPPNRLATYLVAGAGAATAIAVPLSDLDTSSMAGIITGVAAILTAFALWMRGWQQFENRQKTGPDTSLIHDDYDDAVDPADIMLQDVGDATSNVGPDGVPLDAPSEEPANGN